MFLGEIRNDGEYVNIVLRDHEYPDGDLFLFAGLYNELDDNSLTTTILTTEANDFFAEIHNQKKRMPLILDENYMEDWLDEKTSTQSINELMAISGKPKELCTQALQAAQGIPDVAFEFLMSGHIPQVPAGGGGGAG